MLMSTDLPGVFAGACELLSKTVSTLRFLNPRRSTTGPPKNPEWTLPNSAAAKVSPVFAALPVVSNTNQGIVTLASALPLWRRRWPRAGQRWARGASVPWSENVPQLSTLSSSGEVRVTEGEYDSAPDAEV